MKVQINPLFEASPLQVVSACDQIQKTLNTEGITRIKILGADTRSLVSDLEKAETRLREESVEVENKLHKVLTHEKTIDRINGLKYSIKALRSECLATVDSPDALIRAYPDAFPSGQSENVNTFQQKNPLSPRLGCLAAEYEQIRVECVALQQLVQEQSRLKRSKMRKSSVKKPLMTSVSKIQEALSSDALKNGVSMFDAEFKSREAFLEHSGLQRSFASCMRERTASFAKTDEHLITILQVNRNRLGESDLDAPLSVMSMSDESDISAALEEFYNDFDFSTPALPEVSQQDLTLDFNTLPYENEQVKSAVLAVAEEKRKKAEAMARRAKRQADGRMQDADEAALKQNQRVKDEMSNLKKLDLPGQQVAVQGMVLNARQKNQERRAVTDDVRREVQTYVERINSLQLKFTGAKKVLEHAGIHDEQAVLSAAAELLDARINIIAVKRNADNQVKKMDNYAEQFKDDRATALVDYSVESQVTAFLDKKAAAAENNIRAIQERMESVSDKQNVQQTPLSVTPKPLNVEPRPN